MKSANTRAIWLLAGFALGACAESVSLAQDWSISLPTSGSYRTKTSNVAGAGMGQVGVSAAFRFGRIENASLLVEQEEVVSVTPMMPGMTIGSWSKTLPAPSGGWRVSPQNQMGMYVGDHIARVVSSTDQGADTAQHVVTP